MHLWQLLWVLVEEDGTDTILGLALIYKGEQAIGIGALGRSRRGVLSHYADDVLLLLPDYEIGKLLVDVVPQGRLGAFLAILIPAGPLGVGICVTGRRRRGGAFLGDGRGGEVSIDGKRRRRAFLRCLLTASGGCLPVMITRTNMLRLTVEQYICAYIHVELVTAINFTTSNSHMHSHAHTHTHKMNSLKSRVLF